MKDNVLMRVAARWNMPFLIIFAMYTQTHGELGPGGGFQAGVMIAAAFIVYGMVFGAKDMQRIVPRWLTDFLAAGGVLVYVGTGAYCLLQGYTFLDYTAIMPSNPGGGEPWGMVSVEWGVGITVAAVMMTVFNEITEGTLPGQEDEASETDDTEMIGKA